MPMAPKRKARAKAKATAAAAAAGSAAPKLRSVVDDGAAGADDDADYYAVLGVERDASASEIRKAYIQLARTCHPDKLAVSEVDDPAAHAAATARFQHIGHCYYTLSDEQRRRGYDLYGADGIDLEGLTGADLYEMFMEANNIVRVSERSVKDYFAAQSEERAAATSTSTSTTTTTAASSASGAAAAAAAAVSTIEAQDLREYYKARLGNMRAMRNDVIGCESVKDERRMCAYLASLVDSGALPRYDNFGGTAWHKQQAKAKAKKHKPAMTKPAKNASGSGAKRRKTGA